MKQIVATIDAATDCAIPHDAATRRMAIRYAKPAVVAFTIANIRKTRVVKRIDATAAAKLKVRETLFIVL